MAGELKAPESGITVRMYRIGHGDCFLLALPREQGVEPFYILIDCGRKPGSQNCIHKKGMGDIVKHIGEATGHHLDLVIITHEHQDHVNGFWKKDNPYFGDFHIEEAWFAWTEDPADDLANKLREEHKDQLLNLVEARNRLALAIGEKDAAVGRLDSFLSLAFGGEDDQFNLEAMRAAAKDPRKSNNKQGMKLVKDKALENQGVRYLSPGGVPLKVEGSAGVRVFVLAPPRKPELLRLEEPIGDERFPDHGSGTHGLSFAAALRTDFNLEGRASPFSKRYQVPIDRAKRREFFRDHYAQWGKGELDVDKVEVSPNAPWRWIDEEWLYTAESLALRLNEGENNTSLVLAFELPKSKKVLLFTGDAQRGSWLSWDDKPWDDNGQELTTRDLLARTVLYKVGHHGSHNATLDGEVDDDYPNLAWMAINGSKDEFTAMITAVNKWALDVPNPPWNHPLPSIKSELEKKARGRVFQTDTDQPEKPENVSDADWEAFLERSSFEKVYFDYTILDE